MAPFDYTSLIWAPALGWLERGDVLALRTVAGALIIAGSGIIIVQREAALSE